MLEEVGKAVSQLPEPPIFELRPEQDGAQAEQAASPAPARKRRRKANVVAALEGAQPAFPQLPQEPARLAWPARGISSRCLGRKGVEPVVERLCDTLPGKVRVPGDLLQPLERELGLNSGETQEHAGLIDALVSERKHE